MVVVRRGGHSGEERWSQVRRGGHGEERWSQ